MKNNWSQNESRKITNTFLEYNNEYNNEYNQPTEENY